MKIGIVVSLSSTEQEVRSYREIRSLALQAEAAGFDSVWTFDHLFARFPPRPLSGPWEGWTLLTALAEATERVELGTIVLAVPFRNPVLLAKMAATADEISGGRVILGLGAGWHEPEFDAMGIPFGAKVDRFEEALQIIRPLLREGRVSFQGSHYQAVEAEIIPRGPRPAGPPVLIASFGPRMLRLAARHADIWNSAWYGRAGEELEKAKDGILAACRAEDRDPGTLELTAGVSVSIEPAEEPGKSLSGTPQEMAAGLRGFEQAGLSHIICLLNPANERTVAHFAEALRAYRQG